MTEAAHGPCLYGRGRDEHPAVDPVRVATSHDRNGTPRAAYACRPCAPALTVERGPALWEDE